MLYDLSSTIMSFWVQAVTNYMGTMHRKNKKKIRIYKDIKNPKLKGQALHSIDINNCFPANGREWNISLYVFVYPFLSF